MPRRRRRREAPTEGARRTRRGRGGLDVASRGERYRGPSDRRECPLSARRARVGRARGRRWIDPEGRRTRQTDRRWVELAEAARRPGAWIWITNERQNVHRRRRRHDPAEIRAGGGGVGERQ